MPSGSVQRSITQAAAAGAASATWVKAIAKKMASLLDVILMVSDFKETSSKDSRLHDQIEGV